VKLPVSIRTAADARKSCFLNYFGHIRLFRDIAALKAQVRSLCKRQFLPAFNRSQTVLLPDCCNRPEKGIKRHPKTVQQMGLIARRRSQARVRHASCESQGKRHASHAPASLQSKVSRSVPSPGHAPGDDETNFSQGVVPGACPV
jgi:hypothetical protein